MDPAEPATSRFTVTLVVGFIGGALMVCLVGTIVLAALNIEVPGLLADVGKMALGGIIGVLASTRVGNPVPAKDMPPPGPMTPVLTTVTTTETAVKPGTESEVVTEVDEPLDDGA